MTDDSPKPSSPSSTLTLSSIMQGGNLAVLVGFALVVRDTTNEEMKLLEETQISVVKLVSQVDQLAEKFSALEEEIRSLQRKFAQAPTQDDLEIIHQEIARIEVRLAMLERCARDRKRCREI